MQRASKSDEEPSPKSSRARVLVVDNREQVRRDLQRGLEAEGYEVIVAHGIGEALRKDAVRLAKKTRPHVAIVDLRLDDDHDTSDTSGLKLLEELRKRSKAVGLIVYSAYLNPTVDRAINEYGAKWVDKGDAPSDLKVEVGKLATQACAARRPFKVSWPKQWDKEHTVRKLFRDNTPASLLDDVIAQLFQPRRRVWVHQIEDQETPSAAPVSRGRSLVIRVQPNPNATHKVVKVSSAERVRREASNYQRYIRDRMPGQFHTRLEDTCTFWDVGASVYTFLGDDELARLHTFRNFYAAEEDAARLLAPIGFCQRLWGRIYPPRRDAALPIYRQYEKLLDLRNNLERLRAHPVETPLAAGLSNPLQCCYAGHAPLPVGCGLRQVIHGDFHADNLFTDGERLWLVDFERTGYGPVYADFCELEIDVVTRLLPSTVPGERFLQMAQQLVRVDEPIKSSDDDPAVHKAMAFIHGLRKLAFQTTDKPYPHDYQWGLLCDALFVAGMRPPAHAASEQAMQRERAWLYASVICTNLDQTQSPEAVAHETT